jgi:hypothetical protein
MTQRNVREMPPVPSPHELYSDDCATLSRRERDAKRDYETAREGGTAHKEISAITRVPFSNCSASWIMLERM